MKDVIVYDVECARKFLKGKDNSPEALGFACATAYSYKQDKFLFFLHERDKANLINLLNGNVVITFCGIKFDSKNILGNGRTIRKKSVDKIIVSKRTNSWEEYDIYLNCLRVFHNTNTAFDALDKPSRGGMKLEDISIATLGSKHTKSGQAVKAPSLYQQGRFAELFEYNEEDVRLTKMVFERIMNSGRIINGKGQKLRIGYPRVTLPMNGSFVENKEKRFATG